MRILTFILLLISLAAFPQAENFKMVGDIEFDPKTDNKDFIICQDDFNYSFQYFNFDSFDYEGEKLAIENIFINLYDSKSTKKESGLIRIRFIVNCQGKTDRFRIQSVDENYKAKEFDKNITEQLLKITKQLDGWKPKKHKGKEVNYYQYLTFKMEQGQLIEILP